MEDIATNAKIKDFKDIKVVGIDMSMKEFSVDSDNNTYEAKSKYVRLYRINERKLKRLQRRMSKKEKGSSNRWKARQRLAKLERHVANCRLDFCHKLSKYCYCLRRHQLAEYVKVIETWQVSDGLGLRYVQEYAVLQVC